MSDNTQAFGCFLHSGGFPGSFLGAPRVSPDAASLADHAGSVAVLGVPFDGMCISRSGANHGPKAIREASEQSASYNASQDIDLLDHFRIIDCGDASVVPGGPERTFEAVQAIMKRFEDYDITPVTLGGDHSVAIPCLQAFARRYQRPGLILVDSHYDTAEELGGEPLSHCCPITRAVDAGFDPANIVIMGINGWMNPRNEVDYAIKQGIHVIHQEEIQADGIAETARRALKTVEHGTDGVYMSFDIDSIDAAYAPGTGVPAAGGLTSREAIDLVRRLGAAGGGLRGFDLVEVSPPYDSGGVTARLASTLILETLGAIARAG